MRKALKYVGFWSAGAILVPALVVGGISGFVWVVSNWKTALPVALDVILALIGGSIGISVGRNAGVLK